MSEVRAFFDRWQRLEVAKAEISEDLKELFAEAKATGFNTKAMRVAFRAKVKAENETDDDRELAAIVDLYLAEIDGPRARPASARVEKIEEFPPHDAETGEITNPPDPCSSKADDGQPYPSPEADNAKSSGGVPAVGRDPERGVISVHSGQETVSAAQGDNPVASASGASVTNSEDDFNPEDIAFLSRPKAALRLHCLNPTMCGGYGSKHCHACLTARDEALVSA